MKSLKSILLLTPFILTLSVSAQFEYTPKILERIEAQHKLLDGSKPLFINGNGVYGDNGSNVKFGCLIFPFSPYIRQGYTLFPAGSNKNKFNNNTGGYMFNYPIREMFMALYGKSGYHERVITHNKDTNYYYSQPDQPLPASQVEFRNLDSTKYVNRVNGILYPERSWNIQLMSERALSDQAIRKQMILALEMQFGLYTRLEKQKKRCIVLSKNKLPIPLYSSGTAKAVTGYNPKTNVSVIDINDISMDHFLYLLYRHFRRSDYPLVNETGLSTEHLGNISYTIEGKHTFETYKKYFESNGIRFSIEDRLIDVLVITKAD